MVTTIRNRLKSRIFHKVHLSNLVYNTCWEDPRCDRALLHLNADSQVVMLTSAGCNALDYLLDNPQAIHCVDMNWRQSALLDLKIALFRHGDPAMLFRFFGNGRHEQAKNLFETQLSNLLEHDFSKRYWKRHIHKYFGGRDLRNRFYWHGSSGAVAWMLQQWLRLNPGVFPLIQQLLAAPDLDTQARIYAEIEPRILGGFMRWALRQHLLQSMLGVPESQQKLAAVHFSNGMAGYIASCLRRVFAETPVGDNYFWQLYLRGYYTEQCCPNYLQQTNFNDLQQRVGRINNLNTTVSQFLKDHPGQYTHFVLLDHQDWMAANDRDALDEEWRLILQNAAPGARFLLRSAAPDRDFLPEWLGQFIDFDDEAVQRVAPTDRVGTYASTHLGIYARPYKI
jgi:S-adenosylmethionine-diacylglycerol 3-amino-3-carboxypropyl transferase